MDEFTQRLVKQLSLEEGRKSRVYLDTKGIPTIGVGRNLRDVGLADDEIDLLLANDLTGHIKFLTPFAWYTSQSDVRRAALVDLSFMGPEKLLHFVNMIAALTRQDFEAAAAEVKNSQWYKDVGPGRGDRVAGMIETGAWPADVPL
jgi:lysozyme